MDQALAEFISSAASAGLRLSPEDGQRLAAGAQWLARASTASGLSQYRDPADALLRGMGPALAWFRCSRLPREGLLADIGAGNGAIGATIGFFAPEMQIHLVDRARRAYTTSELLVARLGLRNVTPVLSDLAELPHSYDAVVFRALARAGEALPCALSVAGAEAVIGAFHRRGDADFLRPALDLTVIETVPTIVPELVLTCYRR